MSKSNKSFVQLGADDAPSIFALAKSFYDTGRRIAFRYSHLKKSGNHKSMDSNLLAVAAANICFSFELYFKGLTLTETGEFKKVHGLRTLFKGLPIHIQTEVKTLFEKEKVKARGDMPIIRRLSPIHVSGQDNYDPWKSEITLDSFLDAHDEGFVDWRYNFQPEWQKTIYADFSLMVILNKVICRIVKKYVKF